VNALAVVIRLPPEAIPPLAIGLAALFVIIFFGSKLADWKARSPQHARVFGLVTGVLLTGASLYFLLHCLTNQVDPNNEMPNRINFTDAPIAGGMAALAVVFWRFANLKPVAGLVGAVVAALMYAKPFVWPVTRVWEVGEAEGHAYARGLMDPEHLMFLGPATLVVIVTIVCLAKR
jgi:hypothetical protein